MPGTAIGKKLNYGYAGSISRSVDAIVTNKTAKRSIAFGMPVVLNSDNTYSEFSSYNTANDFVGIAVREVKQAISYNNSSTVYEDGERTDVLNRGYICIKINKGIPKANGKVYIRIKEDVLATNEAVGQFEASPDGENTIELENVRFTSGEVDANGIAEVTILSRAM